MAARWTTSAARSLICSRSSPSRCAAPEAPLAGASRVARLVLSRLFSRDRAVRRPSSRSRSAFSRATALSISLPCPSTASSSGEVREACSAADGTGAGPGSAAPPPFSFWRSRVSSLSRRSSFSSRSASVAMSRSSFRSRSAAFFLSFLSASATALLSAMKSWWRLSTSLRWARSTEMSLVSFSSSDSRATSSICRLLDEKLASS